MRWGGMGVALLGLALGCGEPAAVSPARSGPGQQGRGPFACPCPTGETCAPDGACVSICGEVAACVTDDAAECCASNEVCREGACVDDCGTQGVACNGRCCDGEQTCLEGACVAACPSESQLCGATRELCCAADEACVADACVAVERPCEHGEDCDVDERCEPSLGVCISRSALPTCEFRPPVGDFEPVVGCRWTPPGPADSSTEEAEIASMRDVVMTPAVANLTDDDADGVTDLNDTPDVVFVSFDYAADGCCTARGVVRVVSGKCLPDGTMRTHATLKGRGTDDWIGNSSGVALGNLHPDTESAERAPEIVATFKNGGIVAWRRTAPDGSSWEVLWQNDELPTSQHTRGGAQPSIADLDGDGRPEVIVGNVVLDGPTGRGPNDPELPEGALAWDGRALEAETPGADLGIGNNAFLGPISIVADLEQDGLQEVVAGNTVYEHDGRERWTFAYSTANSSCGGTLDCDGYSAVGNFDDDAEAEVVIVRLGEVFVLNHDGSPVPGIPLPIRIPGAPEDVEAPTYAPAAYLPSAPLYDEDGDLLPPERILCGGALRLAAFDRDGEPIMVDGMQVTVSTAGANESGPPTIADFDGDGHAEIGTASSTAYVVLDLQCQGDPLPADCARPWVRWLAPNEDCSSRATGSSVFDFEGDGSAEVVYADETSLRIFRGTDGAVLYEDTSHRSHTRVEMPIVVDVDNDGKSEVVVPEPNPRADLGGIEIWDDADNHWVRTRRIWNQHAYSVTNVTEDGQIPRRPDANWTRSRLNNFRQNVQPAGVFDAPDLLVRGISRTGCDENHYAIDVVVGNDGAASVPPGISTEVSVRTHDGRTFELGAYTTSSWLLPGGSETLRVRFELPEGPEITAIVVSAEVDRDDRGRAQYNECDEENNGLQSNPMTCLSME